MMGRKVRTLVKAKMQKGSYQLQWYGDDGRGFRLPQGIYIIMMQTPGGTLHHKVIVK